MGTRGPQAKRKPSASPVDALEVTAPPDELNAAGRRLWTALAAAYPNADAIELEAMRYVCRTLDLWELAHDALVAEGFTTRAGSGGLKSHPAATVVNNAGVRFVAGLKALGVLEDDVAGALPEWSTHR